MDDRLHKNGLDTSADGRRDLPSTRWSLVVGLVGGSASVRREALGHLFERYSKPIYHYIRLKWSKNPDDARDLTEDFFVALLEGDALQKFQPGRSSFRNYLKGILRNFAADQFDAARALKRGGGVRVISMPDVLHDVVPDAAAKDPEKALDWAWRLTLYERALEQTRKWFLAEKRDAQFRTFETAVLDAKERLTDAQIAAKIGTSESTVGNHINVVRVKLREMIRTELTQTVLDKEQLEEEYRLIIGKNGI
ncbi:MAG TPA: sigma-70 family RNA polymerase sigma factor [Planctomycetota bacterium]|jgi:RNA polymerase sigma-70 factor (ECF subfamily)|nr:sigma-70 family RNA polymerase sigma factor [Planctomycetota bacterium]